MAKAKRRKKPMTLEEFRALGHKARWKNSTKEQRSEAAKRAALARWSKKRP